MSAFVLLTDEAGHVCGGRLAHGALSSEAWRLSAAPIVEIDPETIAWPDGERWSVTDHHAVESQTVDGAA